MPPNSTVSGHRHRGHGGGGLGRGEPMSTLPVRRDGRPPEVRWTDLGRAPYGPVWDLQHQLVAGLKAKEGSDRLLFVEHEPVLTLGRRTDAAHLLVTPATLAERGYEVFEVERGGDVTYHGPGQLVGYPLLDLRRHRRDVRWYAETLLDCVVRVARDFGLAAHARTGVETGVWVDLPGGTTGKLASLGVRIETWVTYHGFALNVSTDLDRFDVIVPCGIGGVQMVSLASLLARPVTVAEARAAFLSAFQDCFAVRLRHDPTLSVAPLGTASHGRSP